MIEPYTKDIEAQMQELYSRLPEKSKRLYAGVEALTHLRRFFMKSGQFLPTARSKINKIF